MKLIRTLHEACSGQFVRFGVVAAVVGWQPDHPRPKLARRAVTAYIYVTWHKIMPLFSHRATPMLFDPLDAVLGATSKVRLLRALVPLSQPLSGREAARRAGISRIAQRALEELANIRLLNRDQSGGQYLYTFNRKHALAPTIEQLFEAEGRFTDGIFQRLRDVIDRIEPVETAVVFGSAARGEAKPSSDLDVLVLVRDSHARDEPYSALVDAGPSLVSEFGVRLSPVVTTVDRFQRQHAEGDPFVAEVLRDARRICGRPIDELIDG